MYSIFAPNTAAKSVIDRPEAGRQYTRTHNKYKYLSSHRKKLTTRMQLRMQSQGKVIDQNVQRFCRQFLHASVHAPDLHSAKFLQRCVRKNASSTNVILSLFHIHVIPHTISLVQAPSKIRKQTYCSARSHRSVLAAIQTAAQKRC